MNGTHIKKAVHSHSCAEKAPTRASILTHTQHTHEVHESEISHGAGGGAPLLTFPYSSMASQGSEILVTPPAPSEVKGSRRKPS